MDIRLPDGTVVKNVPEGMSRDAFLTELNQRGYDTRKLQQAAAPTTGLNAGAEGKVLPRAQSKPTYRTYRAYAPKAFDPFGAGIVKGLVVTPAQAFSNLNIAVGRALGTLSDDRASEYSAGIRDLVDRYDEEFQPTGMGEFVGGMFIPTPGRAAQGASAVWKMAKPMLTGAGLAAGYSAASNDPSKPDFWQNVGSSAGIGAFANPVVSIAATGLGKAGVGIRNLYEKYFNPETQYLNKLVQNDTQLGVKTVQDILAGRVPSSPAYAHAQAKIPAKADPAGFLAKIRRDTKALVDELGQHTGDKDTIKNLIAKRELATTDAYAQVAQQGDVVDGVGDVIADAQAVIQKSTNPGHIEINTLVTTPLKDMIKKLEYRDEITKEMVPITDAGHVQQAIDYIKETLKKNDYAFSKATLVNMKERLTKILPGQKEVDDLYKTMSQPIDRVKVLRALHSKLVNHLGSDLPVTKGAFQNAVNDELASVIRKSTGEKRYATLEDLLDPTEWQSIDAISKKLEHQAELQQAISGGGKAGVKAPIEEASGLNVMSVPIHLAEKSAKMLGTKKNTLLQADMAKEMLTDPNAEAMRLLRAVAKKEENSRSLADLTRAINLGKNMLSKPLSQYYYSTPTATSAPAYTQSNAVSAVPDYTPVELRPYTRVDQMAEEYGLVPDSLNTR